MHDIHVNDQINHVYLGKKIGEFYLLGDGSRYFLLRTYSDCFVEIGSLFVLALNNLVSFVADNYPRFEYRASDEDKADEWVGSIKDLLRRADEVKIHEIMTIILLFEQVI